MARRWRVPVHGRRVRVLVHALSHPARAPSCVAAVSGDGCVRAAGPPKRGGFCQCAACLCLRRQCVIHGRHACSMFGLQIQVLEGNWNFHAILIFVVWYSAGRGLVAEPPKTVPKVTLAARCARGSATVRSWSCAAKKLIAQWSDIACDACVLDRAHVLRPTPSKQSGQFQI